MSPVTASRVKARAQLRAVQYVRMSTEHQQYSPIVQKNAIAEYAAARNIRIVGTYEDAGISGLTLRERQGLMQLLVDVQSSTRRFSTVLVYDVSRWGRFQDVDESAYYEYLCRKAGVQVVYIAEPFDNDGTPITCIFKAVKRAMAGEYSRELSRKVYLGHCLGAQRGLHEGGPPGYGIRRLLLDPDRNIKAVLQRYEYKNLQTDRTRKTPGPVHEVALVHRMFEWYASGRVTFTAIARRLNDFGLYNGLGHPWQASNIRQILTNEKYTGTNLYGRTSLKLHSGWQAMPESEWIRVPGAFEPVVDRHLFNAVQTRRAQWRRQPTKDEVKAALERLLARTGHLSQAVLKSHLRAPTVDQVMKHFGSLLEAYDAVGYEPRIGSERYDVRRAANRLQRRLTDVTIEALRDAGHEVGYEKHTSTLSIDRTIRLQLVVRPPWLVNSRLPCWTARWPDLFPIDYLIYGRTERGSSELLDLHVFPRGSLRPGEFSVLYRNGASLFPMFRHLDMKVLLELAATAPLEVLHEPEDSRSDRGSADRTDPSPQPAHTKQGPASGHRK